MASFRRNGDIHRFREKFIGGMVANAYPRDFAERCFNQIEGFGTYGFPESHAASFSLRVYVSAWIKCFHPEVFACALLNSQPMGFYQPAQIVRDAREHGVAVLPVDVNRSQWDCTLEENPSPPFRGEREGEVDLGERSGIPHLTPPLSALRGGEGVAPFTRPAARLSPNLGADFLEEDAGRLVAAQRREAIRTLRRCGGAAGLACLALERLAAASTRCAH